MWNVKKTNTKAITKNKHNKNKTAKLRTRQNTHNEANNYTKNKYKLMCKRKKTHKTKNSKSSSKTENTKTLPINEQTSPRINEQIAQQQL